MEVKIIVGYHNSSYLYQSDALTPIQLGRAISEEHLKGMIGDDTGDNISAKNKSFCELTGLYWLWKNIDADIYGLFHYHRFLDFSNKYPDYPIFQNINIIDWNSEIISTAMKEYDIALPCKDIHDISLYNWYKNSHYINDLDIALNIIKEKYPDYGNIAKDVLDKNGGYFCNLFVAKKEIFNDYCSWIFDILFELEKRIDIANRDDYQKRVFGYISERLINVYLEAHSELRRLEVHKVTMQEPIRYACIKSLKIKSGKVIHEK